MGVVNFYQYLEQRGLGKAAMLGESLIRYCRGVDGKATPSIRVDPVVVWETLCGQLDRLSPVKIAAAFAELESTLDQTSPAEVAHPDQMTTRVEPAASFLEYLIEQGQLTIDQLLEAQEAYQLVLLEDRAANPPPSPNAERSCLFAEAKNRLLRVVAEYRAVGGLAVKPEVTAALRHEIHTLRSIYRFYRDDSAEKLCGALETILSQDHSPTPTGHPCVLSEQLDAVVSLVTSRAC